MSDDLVTNLQYSKNTKPLLKQFGKPVKPKDSGIQLKLAKTARKGKSRQISYSKINGQFNVYDVQCYSFRNNKGIRYLYAWDLKANSIKSFLVKNISNVSQLQVTHKRLWTVQMGNDPQQLKYWQDQQNKSPQQKRAQKIKQDITNTVEPVNVNMRNKLKDAMSDLQPRKDVFDNIAKDIQKQTRPVIKTISRGQKRPISTIGTKGTIGPK